MRHGIPHFLGVLAALYQRWIKIFTKFVSKPLSKKIESIEIRQFKFIFAK